MGLALLAGATLVILIVMSRRAQPVGLVDGDLRPCPDSPNCVSSLAGDEEHRVEPLYRGPGVDRAWLALRDVLGVLPHAAVRTEGSDYLHVEFTTPVLLFVDDVEFLLDRAAREVHVRSASRVGWYDFGANRTRVEDLRARLEAALAR